MTESLVVERHGTARECTVHPGEPVTYCKPCRVEEHRQMVDDRVAELVTQAELGCDQRFPRRYQFAEHDHPDVRTWVTRYLEAPTQTPNLLLLGPTGRGKTHQAYGALRAAVSRPQFTPDVTFPKPVRWEACTFADLCASLRPRTGVDTEAVMDTYRKTGLLMIDDLAAGKSSEFVEEITYRILNSRYEAMLPSIFTSNLPVPELREALGDRVASRLAESSQNVVLGGDDRRRPPTEGLS